VGGLAYDANCIILSLQRRDDTVTLMDNLTYNYGSNNQLTSVNDAAGQHHDWDAFSSSFDYDANGNMISQTGKFTNIAYEHRNLPVHFYLDNDTELIANYNAEGHNGF
jgi:YD repeat-containing protein